MSKLDTIMLWVGLMGLIVGALGFAVGFFGPIYFMAEANQGPLIGIFITGPGGVVAGAITGAIIGYKKSKRRGGNDI